MNSFIKTNALLATLLTALVFSGCNTVTPQAESTEVPDKTPDITGSLVKSDFIFPKVALSPAGELLPYQSSANPYDLLPSPVVAPELADKFKQALKAKDKGDFKSARALLNEITKAQPELSGPWFQLGNIAAEEQKWDNAVNAYRAAVQANDWNVWAWLALGLSHRQLGDMEAAKNSYIDALQRWPDFANAHKNLAILLDVYLNQPEQAQPHFEAYQVLTSFKDEEANDWVTEISRRTGTDQLMPIWQAPESTNGAPSELPEEGNNG